MVEVPRQRIINRPFFIQGNILQIRNIRLIPTKILHTRKGKTSTSYSKEHNVHSMDVGILMWQHTRPFDMASAFEVFSLALKTSGKVFTIPMDPNCITGTQPTCSFVDACNRCEVLIVPGFSAFTIESLPHANQSEIELLQIAHKQGSTLVSLCTGAFWLASCGILDGRVATTHWQYCEQLKKNYPAVNVKNNVLYVQQDNIWTSAGVSAGTDACLCITRQLLGNKIADSVSKQMAITLERSGSHIQIINDASSSQNKFDNDLDYLHMLFIEHPEAPWREADLAAALGMSIRTLERKFRKWGITPHQWILRERLLMAESLLTSTTMQMDSIAHAVGFSNADLMRRHFFHLFGMTPHQFRSRNTI